MLKIFDESQAGQLCIGIPKGDLRHWANGAGLPQNISVCTVEANETGDLVVGDVVRGDTGDRLIFFCLAYADQSGRAAMVSLVEAPELRQYFHNTEVIEIEPAGPDRLARLLRALANHLAPLACHAADQALALAYVRRDYERVHQRFSTLESFIQRSASHATRERMLISPDRRSDGEFVTIEVGTAPLRQL